MGIEADALRPYKMSDMTDAVHELTYAQNQLEETRRSIKRYQDAIDSFAKQEAEQVLELKRREEHVKKIAKNLEK